MPFFLLSSDENQLCEIHDSHFFERKETFIVTSYPEASNHVNDFDEMLHFIIKATARIIHTIITDRMKKKVFKEKMKCTKTYHEMILCKVQPFRGA